MTETKEPYITEAGNDLLTLAEAGEILSIKPRTVKQWIADGRIEAVRLTHKTVRVRRSAVDEMIQRPGRVNRIAEQPADVALARNVLAVLDNDAGDGRKIELLRELAARVINTKGEI